MSGAKQLVAHGKRVHPQRKKSKAKAWRSAQAAHGYQVSITALARAANCGATPLGALQMAVGQPVC